MANTAIDFNLTQIADELCIMENHERIDALKYMICYFNDMLLEAKKELEQNQADGYDINN
jgi:hypothetical protein